MAATKTTPDTPGFDPGRYLTKLQGNDYLEVKFRILWLRTDHPDARIETDCVSFNDTHAVFKARVELPSGAVATGWGSEEKGHFRDYIEKAETKAIGRALGALGFGTQFADDFSDAASGRIADSPVQRPQAMPAPPRDDYDPNNEERRTKAMKAIFALGKSKGLKSDDVTAIAHRKYEVASMTTLPVDTLSAFWKHLNESEPEDLIEELAELQGVK